MSEALTVTAVNRPAMLTAHDNLSAWIATR